MRKLWIIIISSAIIILLIGSILIWETQQPKSAEEEFLSLQKTIKNKIEMFITNIGENEFTANLYPPIYGKEELKIIKIDENTVILSVEGFFGAPIAEETGNFGSFKYNYILFSDLEINDKISIGTNDNIEQSTLKARYILRDKVILVD